MLCQPNLWFPCLISWKGHLWKSCHGPFGPDRRRSHFRTFQGSVMPTPASVAEGFEGFGAEISWRNEKKLKKIVPQSQQLLKLPGSSQLLHNLDHLVLPWIPSFRQFDRGYAGNPRIIHLQRHKKHHQRFLSETLQKSVWCQAVFGARASVGLTEMPQ